MAGEGEIIIVGTAHVSEQSVDEVRDAIERENPDMVAVELDERRYKAMKGEQYEDLEPMDLIEGSKPFEFMVYWLLSYLQAKIGAEFGVEPGADMKAAIEEAEERDIPIALVDRDIRITVKRLWGKMSIFEKLKFVGALILGLSGLAGEPEDIDIEEITDTDVVELLIDEFRRFSPRGAEALIDERDAYIASNLIELKNKGHRVVAVVGAGHEKGIKSYLESPESVPTRESLESEESGFLGLLNPGGRVNFFKLGGYLISAFVVLMFVLLFMAGVDNEVLAELFIYWFLVNGVLAFLGALIAGGHLTSAAVGGSLAWMTSINPALAPGWFSGYVELRYIDISLADIDSINEILSDAEASTQELLKRLYRVPLFRLLLVVTLTNLGSIIGTGLFIFVVLPVIGADIDFTAELSRGLYNSWDQLVQIARWGIDRVV